MRYFNIKEVKGFTLGKEYFILDQSINKMNGIDNIFDRNSAYYELYYNGKVDDVYEYNYVVSMNNGLLKKRNSKIRKKRFIIVDDFGKNRNLTENQIKNIFINDLDQVVSEIRNIKLNKLNIK
jgi:hypothetical protein